MSKGTSDYELEYRSTIQPRTATQSRQSGGGVFPSSGGGGGGIVLSFSFIYSFKLSF